MDTDEEQASFDPCLSASIRGYKHEFDDDPAVALVSARPRLVLRTILKRICLMHEKNRG